MKENSSLTLDGSGKTPKVWRVVSLVLLALGIIGAAAYATQRYTTGQWTLFATPSSTPTFTHTPVLPTATIVEPSATATPTVPATRSGPMSYVIMEGDTLYYVSEEHEIDIEALIAYNLEQDIDLTSFLQIGQEILIPPPDFTAPTPSPMPSGVIPGTVIEYIVRPGDILQLLADEFNTTLDAILEENEDISENPDMLSVGHKLRIPVDLLTLTPVPPTQLPSSTVIPQPSATPTP